MLLGASHAFSAPEPVRENPNPPALYGPPTTGGVYRSWKNVRIDGGGFVTGMIASAAPLGPLYARTDVGGAYRWIPATNTWLPITDSVDGTCQVESMAADPTDAQVVYLASSGRIWRSANQGGSWSLAKIPAKMEGNGNGRCVGERLAVDPHLPSVLFFGSRHDGLFRSEDSGASWAKVPAFTDWKPGTGITFVLFDNRGGSKGQQTQTIYAAVDGNQANLYASKDSGDTWSAIPNQPIGMFPNHAAISPTGELFLAYSNGCGPGDMTTGAVWRYSPTKAGPDAWANISPITPGKGSGDSFGYGSIALDPRNPDTLVVASMDRWAWGDSMWKTTDANAPSPVWTVMFDRKVKPKWLSPAPYKGRDSHWMSDVEFHPTTPDQLFMAFGQGVHRTDNVSAGPDATWTFSARGLEETVLLSLTSPSAGPPLLSGIGDIGGFAHPDLEASPPVRHSTGNTTGVDFAALAPKILARVGSGKGQYSLDGGESWIPFPAELPKGSGHIAISADGKTFLWTPNGIAHVSRDLGKTWMPVASLPKGTKIVSDRVNPYKFYAYENTTGTIFTSFDAAATFTPSTTKLPGTYGYLRSGIRAVPGFEGHFYVTTQNTGFRSGLYKSIDSGKTLLPISGTGGKGKPLTDNPGIITIQTFGFGKGSPQRKYPALYAAGIIHLPDAGETDGIFRSDDGGTSWVKINDDKHRFRVDVLAGDSRTPGRVYLGTSGRGIIYADP
jgi:photosystem II stability/assembly factor-like uncharacterized protein